MTTVYEAFCDAATRFRDHAFVCVPAYKKRSYHPEGVEFTYGEAAGEVERLKRIYKTAGYGHGHRIAYLLENRPDYLLHMLAANALGVSVVPVNPDYLQDEMQYLLEHSDVDLVVSIGERALDIQKVALKRTRPLPVVKLEEFAGWIPRPRPAPLAGSPGFLSEVSLLYTSGTTGRPKGCILTNDYFLTAGRTYLSLGGVATIRLGQERIYNPLPLFHMNAAAVTFLCVILSGGCLIIPDRFHPTTWWQEVVETRATVIHYLGVVPPMLMNQPKSEYETAHSVRFGLGAGVEPELHEQFETRYGFPLVEVWGMTETGRVFADSNEPRQIHTRAFGRPTDEFLARVIDENNNEVPPGTEGELLVKCGGGDPRRGFFAGYLKNEEATEEAWKGGWFHTGDTVRQDESGMLYFVDRKKNIIRRSGENIAAAEVEAVLQAHEDIAKVAVIAVKDELREEEVMACIVLLEGVAATEETAEGLFSYADECLAYFKTPGWILFLDDLPTTGTQKIQKTRIFGADVDPREQAGAVDFREMKRKKKSLLS